MLFLSADQVVMSRGERHAYMHARRSLKLIFNRTTPAVAFRTRLACFGQRLSPNPTDRRAGGWATGCFPMQATSEVIGETARVPEGPIRSAHSAVIDRIHQPCMHSTLSSPKRLLHRFQARHHHQLHLSQSLGLPKSKVPLLTTDPGASQSLSWNVHAADLLN